MSKIAFIGLGNMGLPMARNLAKAGHHLTGFEIVPAAIEAARAAGLAVNDDTAIPKAEIIITMLPNGKLVLDSYAKLLPAAAKGTLFIDSSTIDVASARQAHAKAAAAGMASLDAPVSGGTEQAFTTAKPILELMGKKIVHCGEGGAGQAAKICNNMILGISMIAVGEAFVLAEKLGLSHQALYDVASTSSGQCWSLTTYCPVPGPVPASPANNNYQPGFAAALMLKDLRLSQEAAEAAGAATALGEHAARLYEHFVEAGQANSDFSGIINMIRSKAAPAS